MPKISYKYINKEYSVEDCECMGLQVKNAYIQTIVA